MDTAPDVPTPAEQIAELNRLEAVDPEPRPLSMEAALRVVRGDAPLSPRQEEVLRLLLRGRSNLEIGEELGISWRTAKHHVRMVFALLRVPNRFVLSARLVEA